MAYDFPLLGEPTISLAKFTHILQTNHSPAAGQAAGIYQAFVSQGVNPAIGLAIAQHESTYGKFGAAVGRNNLFGDRYYPSAAAYGATKQGGFAHFPSYVANAQYEAHLLATSYKGYTARTFAQKYAPKSDHNNPKAYGSAIVKLLNTWSGGKGGIAGPAHPTSPLPSDTGGHVELANANRAVKAEGGHGIFSKPVKDAALTIQPGTEAGKVYPLIGNQDDFQCVWLGTRAGFIANADITEFLDMPAGPVA